MTMTTTTTTTTIHHKRFYMLQHTVSGWTLMSIHRMAPNKDYQLDLEKQHSNNNHTETHQKLKIRQWICCLCSSE
jgi:hypothetical protein